MQNDTSPPPRLRGRGTKDVKEFELISESWEEGVEMSGNAECMSLVDPARYAGYAGQIRFINKNACEQIRVFAVVPKHTRWLYKFGGALNAQAAPPGGGMQISVEPVQGDEIPEQLIQFRLAAGDVKNPERAKLIDVPPGEKGLWYTWQAKVQDEFKFAGQGYVQKRRNLVFNGLGDAEQ
jgi:hypothetical protein